jgi:hypothetical protein
MNAHKQIIENLSGRVYGVNIWCALSGTDWEEGTGALNELIAGERVEVQYQRLPVGGEGKLYKLKPTWTRPELAVDNS